MSALLSRATGLIEEFRRHLSSIMLATASVDGVPDASVVTCMREANGQFVIYLSALAAHTRNLHDNPRASILLVAPESSANTPLARPRLSFPCSASPVKRSGPDHEAYLALFRESFGPTVDVLATLPDFQFFTLQPQLGRLVAGFGAAYAVDPLDWTKLTPIAPRR